MKKLPIQLTFLLSGISGILCAFLVYLNKNWEYNLIFQLSYTKIILILLILIVSIGFFGLFYIWNWEKRPPYNFLKEIVQKNASSFIFIFFWAFIILIFLQNKTTFILFLTPFKKSIAQTFYLKYIQLIVWSAFVFAILATGICIANIDVLRNQDKRKRLIFVNLSISFIEIFEQQKFRIDYRHLQKLLKKHKIGLIIWVLMLLIWGFIWISSLGLLPDDRFWNVAGVPLLPQQIIGVILLVFFLIDLRSLTIEKNLQQIMNHSVFLILAIGGIWTASVMVWQGQELKHTYFAPGPYPPNQEHYPFSDAMKHDQGSQYLIMGRGFLNDTLTDRPFLYELIGVFHLVGGQKYESVVFIQILFLSLIPVFLFLIGRHLHSSIAGISMATLEILQEKNAIESANSAGIINAKVLMSELPAALLLVILTFVVILWLMQNRFVWAVIAGGVFGLAVGVRGNVMVIFPFLLVAFVVNYYVRKRNFKDWLANLLLFGLAILMVTIPYSVETTKKFGIPFFLPKLDVVVNRAKSESQQPPKAKLYRIYPYQKQDRRNGVEDLFDNSLSNSKDLQLPEELISYTTRHFIHNQIMALLIYPLDYKTMKIDNVTMKPFWYNDPIWQGELSPLEGVLLAGNLLIIAFGLGYSIQTWKILGAVPFLVYIGYQLANSLARTSGGRYLVPTDWVLNVYFSLGILALIYSAQQLSNRTSLSQLHYNQRRQNPVLILLCLVLFLGIGSSYMLFDQIEPEISLIGRSKAKQMLLGMDLSSLDFPRGTVDQITNLLNSKDSVVEMGFALYPRYYNPGELNPKSSYLPRMNADYSRIYFILLTEDGPVSVNLIWGGKELKHFPHAEYGLLVGRQKTDYIEGYAFIPTSTNDREVYYAEPSLWE